jgi:hypothetical protein
MGRTLPTASLVFISMKDELKTFQRALSTRDQAAFDEPFVMAGKHTAEVQFLFSPEMELVFMMTMILEMHTYVMEVMRRVKIKKHTG